MAINVSVERDRCPIFNEFVLKIEDGDIGWFRCSCRDVWHHFRLVREQRGNVGHRGSGTGHGTVYAGGRGRRVMVMALGLQ